jgi:hypothetical protein
MKELEAFKHRHGGRSERLWRQDAQRHQRRRTLRVAGGRAARGRPWLGASEIHDPRAINVLKVPFELVLYELPSEVQEAYCASKGAVWPNSPGDVLYSEVELCLAHRLVVGRVPAAEVEAFVLAALRNHLNPNGGSRDL